MSNEPQRVYVMPPQGDAGGLFGLPLAIPPGIVMYETWDRLSGQNLHTVFILAALAGELVLFAGLVFLFFRFVPRTIAIAGTVIYAAVTYAALARMFKLDDIWTIAIALVAAVCAFFFGRALARDFREPSRRIA